MTRDPVATSAAALRSPRPPADARTDVTSLVCLETPALACAVPDGVFDEFGWCVSDTLEWRRPADRWDGATSIDGSDPARMVFVLHAHLDAGARARWPRELARLHAVGLGLGDDEEALAPWAIDDATDGLFARRQRPRDVFWLAADNLNALFWGLHDWAHFHNHGPFEQVAWTEVQCDASALAWLWLNRSRVPLDGAAWETARRQVEALARSRFSAEGAPADTLDLAGRLLGAQRLQDLVRPARIIQS
jgi:hypothetical protein